MTVAPGCSGKHGVLRQPLMAFSMVFRWFFDGFDFKWCDHLAGEFRRQERCWLRDPCVSTAGEALGTGTMVHNFSNFRIVIPPQGVVVANVEGFPKRLG